MADTLMPPVGTEVNCYFGAKRYRGRVVKHGSKFPWVRFKLKNGKVKEGPATVLAHDDHRAIYKGYLAQMFHPTAYPTESVPCDVPPSSPWAPG